MLFKPLIYDKEIGEHQYIARKYRLNLISTCLLNRKKTMTVNYLLDKNAVDGRESNTE